MLRIATVCGVGMGTSLLLKMNVEDVCRQLGIEAEVEHMDVTQAKGARVDVILAQASLAADLGDLGKPVLPVRNFMDKQEIAELLKRFLADRGSS
ncbi:MAG TPA: PTS sugar transporter subunit IIB [Thermaerobacter sp.]